eukprot:TRINITY_DN90294_c0_g1_i1.p1 TRINITY_DN90294_c0_g1~~TRINITY_DN90294_c0_g1_i1.p1  ORF type:complete len:497 (+),score=42.38 TRINITY_DN90294_c0_g1_i1:79-1569(+)
MALPIARPATYSRDHVAKLVTPLLDDSKTASCSPASTCAPPSSTASTISAGTWISQPSPRTIDIDMSVSNGLQATRSSGMRAVDIKAHDNADQLSTTEALFNLVNIVVGIGVLNVPYAFKLCGSAALGCVGIVVFVTAHTGVLLGRALDLAQNSPLALDVHAKSRDYAFLADVAFGRRGRTTIAFVTALEVWFALVTFIAIIGANADIVLSGVDATQAVIVSCVLAFAGVFLPMKCFSYISLASSGSLVLIAISLGAAAWMLQSWPSPAETFRSPTWAQLWMSPQAIGVVVFCFAGHPCMPLVHECLREPGQWTATVNSTFVVALLYYAGFGAFGYAVFGDDVQVPITKNLAGIPGAIFWKHVAVFSVLVKIQFTAPLLLNAVLSALRPAQVENQWSLDRLVILGVLTVGTGFAAAAFSHEVGALAALTGSLFTMTTSVFFPIVVYWRLKHVYCSSTAVQTSADSAERFAQLSIFLAGMFVAVAGTAQALHDLSKN